LYEPFFDALLERSEQAGFRIRAIWAHDMANQGASGVLNEQKLGDTGMYLLKDCFDGTVDWFDNSRDLLNMIQIFNIPQPIIGLGHSMGAAHTYLLFCF